MSKIYYFYPLFMERKQIEVEWIGTLTQSETDRTQRKNIKRFVSEN